MSSKVYNVGIVGYGFSAKIFHIPFVKEVPELNLYAVVQRTPKEDDNVENDYPGVKSFRTAEEMVQDPAIDVVIITTAPDSHFALSKLALEAGKHGKFREVVDHHQDGETKVGCTSRLREALHPHHTGSRRARRYCEEEQQAACCVPEYVLIPCL